MTPIDKLRQALAASNHTPLPWIEAGPSFGDPLPRYINEVVTDCVDDFDGSETICTLEPEALGRNAALIVAAVNAAPALLEELDALRAEVARLSADAQRYQWLTSDDEWLGDNWRRAWDNWDGSDGKAGFDAAIDAARKGAEG